MEIRIVGQQGRLTWRVHGKPAAIRELELLREFLSRAGIELLEDGTALAGSIEVNHNAARTLLSWRTRVPTTDRRGVVLLALALLSLLVVTSLPRQHAFMATAGLSLLVLTALVLAIVAVRARRANTSIEVTDEGWQLWRSGLFRTHRHTGGTAMLPGRVVGLHGAPPVERALQLRDPGAPAPLDPAELSPPEMCWLAARVVDRLELDHHAEPRAHAARLVI